MPAIAGQTRDELAETIAIANGGTTNCGHTPRVDAPIHLRIRDESERGREGGREMEISVSSSLLIEQRSGRHQTETSVPTGLQRGHHCYARRVASIDALADAWVGPLAVLPHETVNDDRSDETHRDPWLPLSRNILKLPAGGLRSGKSMATSMRWIFHGPRTDDEQTTPCSIAQRELAMALAQKGLIRGLAAAMRGTDKLLTRLEKDDTCAPSARVRGYCMSTHDQTRSHQTFSLHSAERTNNPKAGLALISLYAG
jgi:hypothetical protein